jgi:membrane protease YdiL (CAAX protease family)
MFTTAQRKPLLVFFGLACCLAWVAWFPLLTVLKPSSSTDPVMLLTLVGTAGPALAARIVGGPAAAGSIRRSLARWRVAPAWYGVALLLTPALVLLAALVQRLVGGNVPPYPWAGLVPALVVGLIVGLGEEPGWRGYLLPALQRRHRVLTASLIVGLVWGMWHLPMLVLVGRASLSMAFAIGFATYTLDMVAGSILFAWLYNATGGSLLLTVLFHMSFNATLNVYWQSVEGPFATLLSLVLWLAAATIAARTVPARLGSGRRLPSQGS